MLDIGTGQGLLASLFLDAFPAAIAVGLDMSEPMREVAAERMASYHDRFRFVVGNFAEGELPPAARGPFDVVVASRSIHHVPSRAKQLLYASIYEALAPGGGRPSRNRPDEDRARPTWS